MPLNWYQNAGTLLRNPPHLLCRYLQIDIWTHFAAQKRLVQEAARKASEYHMLLYTGIMFSHCPVKLGIKLIFIMCLQARTEADVCKHMERKESYLPATFLSW